MKPVWKRSLLMRLALGFAGTLLLLTLFSWLALPSLIRSQAPRIVAEKTGHQLTLDLPEFNPLDLTLRVPHLTLTTPDGQPLLAFDNLLVDLAARSLFSPVWAFDAIRFEQPVLTLVELPEGRLNWSAFVAGLSDPESAAAKPPQLDIGSLQIAAGRLDFADRRVTPGFATVVTPIDFELTELTTQPDDSGKFRLVAHTTAGANIELVGELALNPVAVSGQFKLAGIDLGQFSPYLGFLPAPPQGKLAVTADYRVGNGGTQPDVVLEGIEARLDALRLSLDKAKTTQLSFDRIELGQGRFALGRQVLEIGTLGLAGGQLALAQKLPGPTIDKLALEQVRVDLAAREVAIGRAALAGVSLQATRLADGRIDLFEGLQALRAAPPAADSGAAGEKDAPAWHYRLDKLEVAGSGVSLSDARVTPAATLAFNNLALHVAGISDDLAAALPVTMSFDARSGGRFEAQGTVVPAGPLVQLKLKLADFTLAPLQPYLAEQADLVMTAGRLETAAELRYDAKGIDYRGEVAVRDLRLAAAATGATFLAWKNLASRDFHLSRDRLDIGELRLNQLDTQLVIDKDRSTNFKRILRPAAAPEATPASVPAPEGAVQEAPRSFVVNIDRLRFFNGEMDFTDHSLLLPFGTRIHGLRGSITQLSSQPVAPAQIELEGAVDDYGLARARGQANVFNPAQFTDVHVLFRNVEMTRLTPYSATFAGRKIDSGKLSLDLQYKVEQRRMQGENRIVMDRLELGERVDSPHAQDLPLDLAIAVLQDSDGRIDLGLPVSGNLDDPAFSYGQIVGKAIANVLGKIATAPFRALAALFGGGTRVDSIAFEAGTSALTPPEREKVVQLAAVLAQRPNLLLAVGADYAEADRLAVQDAQLRRNIVTRMGGRADAKWDPGALSTGQPKVREALEAIYKERVGAAELAALKAGYREANPGQLEESVAGRVMSRLTSLLHEKKTLSAEEQAQLKGADFYAILYNRLRAVEDVREEGLLALAQARSVTVIDALKTAGVAAERLQVLPPEKLAGPVSEVPVRLVLEAAK